MKVHMGFGDSGAFFKFVSAASFRWWNVVLEVVGPSNEDDIHDPLLAEVCDLSVVEVDTLGGGEIRRLGNDACE